MSWIYLDLRKDTNFYPFARFLPLGRISCEGPGNGRFLTSVVNFVFRTFWADRTLLCAKYVEFSGRKFPGKGRKFPGKGRKFPARLNMTEKRKNEVSVFSWNGNFYFEVEKSEKNGQKSDKNLPWTEICNQWISRYIYIYGSFLKLGNPKMDGL